MATARRELKPSDLQDVDIAIAMLRQARDLLKTVGALKSAKKVRLALKSAEGARRHVIALEMRAYYEARRAEGTA